MQKEIREEKKMIRDGLQMERSYFGPHPLNEGDASLWEKAVSKYERLAKNVNTKINKYNLVVPIMNKQQFVFDLKREADNVLVNGKCRDKTDYSFSKKNIDQVGTVNQRESFLDIFNLFFSKNST